MKFKPKYLQIHINSEEKITDEDINKLEKVFGFSFYEWQKKYLKGEDSVLINVDGRGNGKTFIYCLRLLLEEREPFSLKDINKLIPIDGIRNPVYTRWFRHYIFEINKKLINNGWGDTNLIVERGKK